MDYNGTFTLPLTSATKTMFFNKTKLRSIVENEEIWFDKLMLILSNPDIKMSSKNAINK